VDWASLLTEDRGLYEPGAFDARRTPPRPTAIAAAIRALARGTRLPACATTPGWWDCDEERLSVVAGWGPAAAALLEPAEPGTGDAAA
jgi:dTDP-4-dehydrorhamnose reductase